MANGPAQLTGTVVHLIPPTVAPRLSGRLAAVFWGLGLLVLLLPAVIAILIVQFAMSLIRTSPPSRSFSSGFMSHLFARLAASHLGISRTTVVTFARVRDTAGRVANLRIEGHADSGALAVGDLVTVRVRTVRGVHLVVDGHNHTSNERIRFRG